MGKDQHDLTVRVKANMRSWEQGQGSTLPELRMTSLLGSRPTIFDEEVGAGAGIYFT